MLGIGSITDNSIFQSNYTHLAANKPETTQGGLSPDEQAEVKELKTRDAEVRRHEQAHLAAAGSYARSGAKFDFQTGPDGQKYAIGGEVELDIAPVPDNPDATIQKAKTIKKAALAPEKPSAQDRRVAALADKLEIKARQDLAEKKMEQPSAYNARGQINAPLSKSDFLDITI